MKLSILNYSFLICLLTGCNTTESQNSPAVIHSHSPHGEVKAESDKDKVSSTSNQRTTSIKAKKPGKGHGMTPSERADYLLAEARREAQLRKEAANPNWSHVKDTLEASNQTQEELSAAIEALKKRSDDGS